MSDVTMKQLLEAGAHFGHQRQKWNPRMKPYIFGERRGIHIINLEQTVPMFEAACERVEEIVANGGDVLFVGTKRQAKIVIEEQAKRCQMHYITSRWLGGTLTNFKTIQTSINRLKDLESKLEAGGFANLKKKERRQIEREIAKLKKSLQGIKNLEKPPAAIFIIDPSMEAIAKREANRLGITVIAVTDTNCDPVGIDCLIPGNDDAMKSIRIFTEKIADACLAGLERRQEKIRADMEAEKAAEASAAAKKGKAEVKEVEVEKATAFVSREVVEESQAAPETEETASATTAEGEEKTDG